MKMKKLKVKSCWLPKAERCEHIQRNRECSEGCYVLERGTKEPLFNCENGSQCVGHVYKRTKFNNTCFGDPGRRIVRCQLTDCLQLASMPKLPH